MPMQKIKVPGSRSGDINIAENNKDGSWNEDDWMCAWLTIPNTDFEKLTGGVPVDYKKIIESGKAYLKTFNCKQLDAIGKQKKIKMSKLKKEEKVNRILDWAGSVKDEVMRLCDTYCALLVRITCATSAYNTRKIFTQKLNKKKKIQVCLVIDKDNDKKDDLCTTQKYVTDAAEALDKHLITAQAKNGTHTDTCYDFVENQIEKLRNLQNYLEQHTGVCVVLKKEIMMMDKVCYIANQCAIGGLFIDFFCKYVLQKMHT